MECARWTDEGLLYTSGELESARVEDFRSHLSECDSCREEFSAYSQMKRDVFAPGVLEVAPPKHVDQEILRVWARPAKSHTGIPVFSTILKKTAVSAAFLVAGFLGTGYFVYVMQSAPDRGSGTRVADESPVQTPAPSPSQPALQEFPTGAVASAQTPDSITKDDSTGIEDVRPFSEQRGDLSAPGVTTVKERKTGRSAPR